MNIEQLNNPDHTFVIAEAGSNWKCGTFEEDLVQAKRLIDVACDSGSDAVKFQIYRSETVYASNAGNSSYLSERGSDADIHSIFKRHSMPYDMIPLLSDYCIKKNIMFMSSPFSIQDAQELEPYVQIHKIASFEINHIPLLKYLFATKKPIIISTGASTYDEIDFVVRFSKQNKSQIALLQCTSKYPCPLDSLNISVIQKLKSKYNIPVGFSDHSTHPLIAPILAIGLGATIIEKHFTLDKSLSGPDHSFALDPNELKLMIMSIRDSDAAKGTGDKNILDVEQELRRFATRSLQATKNISKGDILKLGFNFDVLRPGNQIRGIEPRYLEKIEGKKSAKNLEIGEGILDYK